MSPVRETSEHMLGRIIEVINAYDCEIYSARDAIARIAAITAPVKAQIDIARGKIASCVIRRYEK